MDVRHSCGAHTCRQNRHTQKNKTNKPKKKYLKKRLQVPRIVKTGEVTAATTFEAEKQQSVVTSSAVRRPNVYRKLKCILIEAAWFWRGQEEIGLKMGPVLLRRVSTSKA